MADGFCYDRWDTNRDHHHRTVVRTVAEEDASRHVLRRFAAASSVRRDASAAPTAVSLPNLRVFADHGLIYDLGECAEDCC